MLESLARGCAHLVARLDGPLHFRLIVQPIAAVALGVSAGLRDAREGRPPFLWALFWGPDHRAERVRDAWSDLRRLFFAAAVVDALYQIVVHAAIYALELLVSATLLVVVPYALVRGPVARLASARARARGLAHG